jgi:hypothetical protein
MHPQLGKIAPSTSVAGPVDSRRRDWRGAHSLSMADLSDAEKLERIRQILAEPVPRWFQDAHRRANSYAEQLRRIAAVVDVPVR